VTDSLKLHHLTSTFRLLRHLSYISTAIGSYCRQNSSLDQRTVDQLYHIILEILLHQFSRHDSTAHIHEDYSTIMTTNFLDSQRDFLIACPEHAIIQSASCGNLRITRHHFRQLFHALGQLLAM